MALVATDKGIPLPERWTGSKRQQKYPWDTMEVGESFLITSTSGATMLLRSAMSSRPGKKYEARKVDGRFRIWRTA